MQRFLTTNHFAGSDREQLNWLMGFSRLNMRPVAARNSRGSCLNFPIQGRSRPAIAPAGVYLSGLRVATARTIRLQETASGDPLSGGRSFAAPHFALRL